MRHSTRFALVCLALAAAAPVFAQTTAGNSAVTVSVAAPVVASDNIAPISRVIDTASMPVAANVAVSPDVDAAGAPTVGLRAGVHARETARPDRPMAAAVSQHMGQDRAMMVVGVAALVAGAIIGGAPGTIVMVGGAIVGLMGLYNYLQ